MRLDRTGWPFLGLTLTVIYTGMVRGLNNVQYGVKVDWHGDGVPEPSRHMTIAFYKDFPDAKISLHQGAMAICYSVYEATRGKMKASGNYDATGEPRDKFCRYHGPIKDVIKGAREALRHLGADEIGPCQSMAEPQIEVGLNQRDKCPPSWDFDLSHIYSYSPERGTTSYPCSKPVDRVEEHNTDPKTKDTGEESPPKATEQVRNGSLKREPASAWSSLAVGAAFWKSNWVLIPGGIALFVVGVGVIIYIINTRKVRLDSATF